MGLVPKTIPIFVTAVLCVPSNHPSVAVIRTPSPPAQAARLKEHHAEFFQRAKEYEEISVRYSQQFYWCQSESLAELERPERIAEITANWEASSGTQAR